MTDVNNRDLRWIKLIKEQLDSIKFGSVKVEIVKRNNKVQHLYVEKKESFNIQ